VATRIAPGPREAPAEITAGQISTELPLDVAREPAIVVLAGVGEEGLEVLADETVKNGLVGRNL
jgi:hypothetical protein